MVVLVEINALTNIFGTDISYPVLTAQEVINSTQYYAQNTGMVYATTDIEYNLSEIPGIGIEFPSNFYTSITEVLDEYLVE